MKKIILKTAGVLLASGGIAAGSIHASSDQVDTGVQTNQVSEKNHHDSGDLETYQEYNMLDENIENIEDYQAKVVADNPHKRVIILSDDNTEQYKSIFIKKTNRLKIIDLDNGQIFNQVLSDSDKSDSNDEDDTSKDESESSNDASDNMDDFPEFGTLQNEVNADNDWERIAEDNQHKRIIFVQSEDNEKQFKSIFIKDTNRLKIIDLDNGQVFNQIIK